jgi:hypothetical protein
MKNDPFFEHLSLPTPSVDIHAGEREEQSTFGLSSEDFDRHELEKIPPEAPIHENVSIDAEFTSEFIIDFFDGVQEPLFYWMNRSRRIRKYFTSRQQYAEASELSRKTEEELKKQYPDAFDTKNALAKKYFLFSERMKKVKESLPFTADERRQLEHPVKKLVEKAGMDIPPGMAMVMVCAKIISSRVIDLYAD